MKRQIIPYKPYLTALARHLRNNATKSEIYLWQRLKNKQMMGYDFHRQKPLGDFICDFFCYDLLLAIEVDGLSHSFQEAEEKDKKKDLFLDSVGVTILRFSTNQVFNDMPNVILALTNWIEMNADK